MTYDQLIIALNAEFILEKKSTKASVRIISETYDFMPDLDFLPLAWF